LEAQTAKKADKDCLRLTESDWGPNFGEQWHRNEAIFWGCKLGIPAETVADWQKVDKSSGMIQDAILTNFHGAAIVILELVEGSTSCFSFVALQRSSSGWSRVWEDSGASNSTDYCAVNCPAFKMKVKGLLLVLSIPQSRNAEVCDPIDWREYRYHWDGHTFQPASAKDSN
jgi:hypothetical protein